MAQAQPAVVAVFKTIAQKDEKASKEAGRPIYKDLEVCEYRYPGNRLNVPVFPAHSFAGWRTDEHGNQEQVTYAMKHAEQYRRFKEGLTQVQEGTPLSELPFLSQSKRLELKALSILTAEQLAALDGQNLKALGPGGRELKNQAQAYIDNANGSAEVTRLAADNAALKLQIEEMRAEMAAMHRPAEKPADSLDAMDDEALKEVIKEKTGARPRGNPSHETLVRMAQEAA